MANIIIYRDPLITDITVTISTSNNTITTSTLKYSITNPSSTLFPSTLNTTPPTVSYTLSTLRKMTQTEIPLTTKKLIWQLSTSQKTTISSLSLPSTTLRPTPAWDFDEELSIE